MSLDSGQEKSALALSGHCMQRMPRVELLFLETDVLSKNIQQGYLLFLETDVLSKYIRKGYFIVAVAVTDN